MPLQSYRLTKRGPIPLEFSASSLDELTGRLSEGFYTTFTTLSGGTRVLGLTSHLKRLYDPIKDLHIRPSVDEAHLRKYIADFAQTNLPDESRIRLILTKDTGDVFIGIQPFSPLPASVYEKGVHVITAEMSRHDPRIKGTDFIAQSAEQRKLVKGDVFEILLTRHGKILEGMTSNFYAIKRSPAARKRSLRAEDNRPRNDVRLITAQKGILLGVTRRMILKLARAEGMSIEYRPPGMDEDFDEAFLTSSSRGVVPIVRINGKAVGQGRVGEYSKRLMRSFGQRNAAKSESLIPEDH